MNKKRLLLILATTAVTAATAASPALANQSVNKLHACSNPQGNLHVPFCPGA